MTKKLNHNEIARTILSFAPNGASRCLFGPKAKRARTFILTAITGKNPLAKDTGFYKTMAAIYATFPVGEITCQADLDHKTNAEIKRCALQLSHD